MGPVAGDAHPAHRRGQAASGPTASCTSCRPAASPGRTGTARCRPGPSIRPTTTPSTSTPTTSTTPAGTRPPPSTCRADLPSGIYAFRVRADARRGPGAVLRPPRTGRADRRRGVPRCRRARTWRTPTTASSSRAPTSSRPAPGCVPSTSTSAPTPRSAARTTRATPTTAASCSARGAGPSSTSGPARTAGTSRPTPTSTPTSPGPASATTSSPTRTSTPRASPRWRRTGSWSPAPTPSTGRPRCSTPSTEWQQRRRPAHVPGRQRLLLAGGVQRALAGRDGAAAGRGRGAELADRAGRELPRLRRRVRRALAPPRSGAQRARRHRLRRPGLRAGDPLPGRRRRP